MVGLIAGNPDGSGLWAQADKTSNRPANRRTIRPEEETNPKLETLSSKSGLGFRIWGSEFPLRLDDTLN